MCVPPYPQITTYTQKPPLSMICKDDQTPPITVQISC